MSPKSTNSNRLSHRLALVASFAIGSALALGAGCTFEPPGSVLDNGGGGGGGGAGADAGGGGDEGDAGPAASDETMTITYTTQPVGNVADYAPRNVVATWIEDSGGAFVQTINRQSLARTQHLVAWSQMSGGQAADEDAVTGATRANHATPVSATWAIPAALPDGSYTIRVETCDQNSNDAAQNTQGTFTFEKNGTASSQTPAVAGYSNVSIEYSGRP